MKTKFIALLTDFGDSQPFVGVVKSVLYSKNKNLTIIDLTHSINSQDIKTGAFYLMTSINYLPENTIVLAVVDPEVGTGRSILWTKTEHHQIIAPDNGIISWVEEREKIVKVRTITNKKLFLEKISFTFHARDIMAPACALIAKGFKEEEIGPEYEQWKRIPFPHPQRIGNVINGEIIAIDKFGNVITNIRKELVSPSSVFTIKDVIIKGITLTYALGNLNQEIAIIGSDDFIEFAIRNSSFAHTHNIKIGEKVEVIINI